jgi:hypothetical protein
MLEFVLPMRLRISLVALGAAFVLIPLGQVRGDTVLRADVPLAVSGVSISGVTATEAVVSWTTNGGSDSVVLYDAISQPGNGYAFSSSLDPSLVTSHRVSLGGLAPGKTYFFKAKSTSDGAVEAYSAERTFTTSSAGSAGGGGGSGGAPSGGGGGGGLPGGPGVTNLAPFTSIAGVFNLAADAASQDSRVSLHFPKGTVAAEKDGAALRSVSITPVSSFPPSPDGTGFVGLCYELGPSGATFSPGIVLTFFYSPSDVPAGLSESRLNLSTWDEAKSSWIPVPGAALDAASHSLTATLTHFSKYAILVPNRPAFMSFSNLSINPATAKVGSTMDISIQVANQGDLGGLASVTLTVDGERESVQELTLDGGASRTVSFKLTARLEGTLLVNVNGLQETVEVLPVEQATPGPTVAAPISTPALALTSLGIEPRFVQLGDEAEVTAVVANTGDATGRFAVSLRVNGNLVDTTDVSVGPKSSTTVRFAVTATSPGQTSIEVNGKTAILQVSPPVGIAILPFNWLPIAAMLGCITALATFLALRWRGREQAGMAG